MPPYVDNCIDFGWVQAEGNALDLPTLRQAENQVSPTLAAAAFRF
ncbi:hypothetical protein [Verrucomicrobium sp. BvORR106]|nr:hypothetical protein [Verrucomicrobium sp. BvORR106]